MHTTEVTTWVQDIGQLGPVYPFVGTEFILFVVGMAFWLAFHILQSLQEKRELGEEERSLGQSGRMKTVLSARDHQDRF